MMTTTNKDLLEKAVLAVAPAVAKYHLDLQLSNKSGGESDFILDPDSARFIAEDSLDIAKAIIAELEAKPEPAKISEAAKAKLNGSTEHKTASDKKPGAKKTAKSKSEGEE